MTYAPGAFEIEAGTLERFLELLRSREEESGSEEPALPRRAVFVAPLRHVRTFEHGIPVVTRRVRASFAYGADLVTLTYVTADGYEFPDPADDAKKNEARQDEVLQNTKVRIEEGLSELGLALPVVVAWLKQPGSAGGARRNE